MKLLQAILFFISISICAEQSKEMNQELFKLLEEVSKEMFHLSLQEVLDLIHQEVGPIAHITAQDLQAKMAQNPNLLVINVLSKNWYDDCHITSSINIPLTELIYKVAGWDRNQEIVVYCALDECDASDKAYVLLKAMGFASVVDYTGGIKEWFQLGLPVQGPCEASYLRNDQVSRNFDCLKSDF